MLRCIVNLPRTDVLLIREHPVALPVSISAWIMRVIVVQEVNGLPSDALVTHPNYRKLGGILSWAQVLQYRLSDHLVAVTPGLVEWLHRKLPNHRSVSLVTNAVDLERVYPVEVRPHEVRDLAYVVMISSFSPWHDIETLLEAVELDVWPKSVSVVLIGDGPKFDEISARVRSTPRVKLLGRKSPADIAA